MPGDVVFALGALLMAWDFVLKLRPLFPRFIERLIPGARGLPGIVGGAP
jgi:nitric oxide reductase subunit B